MMLMMLMMISMMTMTTMQAWTTANGIFPPGGELVSISVLMKRLKAGAMNRGRGSSTKLSVSGKLKLAAAKKKVGPKDYGVNPRLKTLNLQIVQVARLLVSGKRKPYGSYEGCGWGFRARTVSVGHLDG
jgi:hypothetical protein